MQTVEDRKIPQCFSLKADQIIQLQEKSKETGKSLSELGRDAITAYLKHGRN